MTSHPSVRMVSLKSNYAMKDYERPLNESYGRHSVFKYSTVVCKRKTCCSASDSSSHTAVPRNNLVRLLAVVSSFNITNNAYALSHILFSMLLLLLLLLCVCCGCLFFGCCSDPRLLKALACEERQFHQDGHWVSDDVSQTCLSCR